MSFASFGQVLGSYGKRKGRGDESAPTDPVRASSFDIEDPRAKPGRTIGDGTPAQAWAFKKAQLAAARWLYEKQRDEDYVGEFKMQAKFLLIFERMMNKFLFPKNGDFSASYAMIAEECRESESTVKRAILVLEFHGFLFHVRRSMKIEGAEGSPGPQRKQAPNAYGFDCASKMAKPLWKVFWENLIAHLKRVDKIAARAAHGIKQCFNSALKPAPRATNTELRMALARYSDALDRRDGPPPGASAPQQGAGLVRCESS